MKKFLLWTVVAFCLFFVGSQEVDARQATFSYCVYSVDSGYKITENDTLGSKKVLRILYRDNYIYAVAANQFRGGEDTFWGNFNNDNDRNLADLYKGTVDKAISLTWSINQLVNDLKIPKNISNGCPSTITTDGVWEWEWDWNNSDLSNVKPKRGWEGHEVVYNLNTGESINNLASNDRVCSYRPTNPSKPSPLEITQFPHKIENNIVTAINVDIVLPGHDYFSGKESYSYYNIERNPDAKAWFSSVFLGFWTGGKTFYYGGVSDESAIMQMFNPQLKFVNPVNATLEYIQKYTSAEECPKLMVYNPNNGFYLGTVGNMDLNGDPDLRGTDTDYAIYKYDNTKWCENQLTSIQSKVESAESTIRTIETEIDGYIQNGGPNYGLFTVERLEEIQTELNKVQESLDTLSFEKIKKDCDELATKIDDMQKRILDIKDTVTKDKPGTLLYKIKQAANISTKMTDEDQDKVNTITGQIKDKYKLLGKFSMDEPVEQSCESIFGFGKEGTVGELIQTIFDYIKIIAPILVIIFGTLDFGKAVMASDQDSMKKAQANFVKRLIAAVAIYFVPTIVMVLLKMIDSNLEDPTCGLR